MNQLDESTLQQLAQFENSEQLLWFSVWTTFQRNNVWCRDWNGSDPRHVQGCQDGSTGLESQVPRQKCRLTSWHAQGLTWILMGLEGNLILSNLQYFNPGNNRPTARNHVEWLPECCHNPRSPANICDTNWPRALGRPSGSSPSIHLGEIGFWICIQQ